MWKFVIFLFVFFLTISGAASSSESSCSCNEMWRLAVTTSANGEVTQGSKTDLLDAVMTGADIRILLPSSLDGYLTSVQNAHTIGDNVCVQALLHINKASYDMFQKKAYWWFVNVCTTGQVHMTRYYVGIHQHVSSSKSNFEIKWFIRSMTNTALRHTSSNTVVSGSLDDLISDVTAGSDVRIVTECDGYAAPMDSLEISENGSLVVGQSLFHVSQKESSPNYEFQEKAYWWFTNWVSNSNLHMSRWSIGEHVHRGDTSAKRHMTWYTDSCWQLAYRHDAEGNQIDGSLVSLRLALLDGHRVKLVYGDTVNVEPDEVTIRGGHVNAVIIRMVKKDSTDITKFDSIAQWYWRIISTTGKETTLRVKVGEYAEQGRTESNRAVAWYIDTRPWIRVLVNDKNGKVQSGSKADLVAAVNSGARVRYTLRFKDPNSVSIHEADSRAIQKGGGEVGAMHVRSVSLKVTSGTEVGFQPKPYWWFTISSTTGKVDMSRWTVGEHGSRGHTNDKATIEWFVNF